MKTKTITPAKTLSTADKQKAATVAKLITRIQTSGSKQDFIAEQIGVSSRSLSRFVNKHDGYLTQSMIDKLSKYFDEQ
jgi:plasmid maintenance system antidote protein VapI